MSGGVASEAFYEEIASGGVLSAAEGAGWYCLRKGTVYCHVTGFGTVETFH